MKNYSIFSLKVAAAAAAASLLWSTLPAHGQIAVQKQGYIPFTDEPINYRSNDLHDPVANLQKRLDKGEVTLEYEPRNGYLRSVLRLLNIPVSSQTLVFSKTSFQYKKISPETPRALYFNDDVYVGQVHEGKALEFVSFDPMQGAIFYLLDEQKADRPRLERAELDCTQCHIAASTRNVPGVFLRSVYTQPAGTLVAKTPQYITGQQSPIAERWGGWYVTGTAGDQKHLGNVLTATAPDPLGDGSLERVRCIRISFPSQRHRGSSGAGPSDPDAQPDYADQLSGANRSRPSRSDKDTRPRVARRYAALPRRAKEI